MTTEFRRKIAGRETESMTQSDLIEFKLELEAQLSNRKSQLILGGATADEKDEYESWRNSVICIIKNIDKEMVHRRGIIAQNLTDPTTAESTKARTAIAHLAMLVMAVDPDNEFVDEFTPRELERAAEIAVRTATICHTEVWRVLDKEKKQ